MHIGVLQWISPKLLLLKNSDQPQIELKVVRLNWGPHHARRNEVRIQYRKISQWLGDGVHSGFLNLPCIST